MPSDKFGNKLTWKEYMNRWKKGVTEINPYQQVLIQINSTWIIIFGLLAGIVICIIGIRNLWWLLLILVGGLGNTLIQLIGLLQKRNVLKPFYTTIKEETYDGEYKEAIFRQERTDF